MKIANVYIGLNVIGLKVNVNPNSFQVLKINILFDFRLYLERSYESRILYVHICLGPLLLLKSRFFLHNKPELPNFAITLLVFISIV